VVLFFAVAQTVSWVLFQERPTPAIWLGGALILTGGVVMSVFIRVFHGFFADMVNGIAK